jgi:hypothetical protein
MITRHQDQLQLPACLEALRRFFPFQEISDELPLIRGRPFATAKWIQEYETVPDEHRTENLRGLLECLAKFDGVLPGSVTSAVIEDDRGKRTATCGPPQKALQSKTATHNRDSLRARRFSDLRDFPAGNRQRDCEQEHSSHRDLLRSADPILTTAAARHTMVFLPAFSIGVCFKSPEHVSSLKRMIADSNSVAAIVCSPAT